jgi:thiamine pyrophosphate-dependent acetolactate synthase large subunit-like protein
LDIDPAEIDKNVKATVPVWGDCKETLPLLTALVEERTFPEWLQQFRDHTKEEVDLVIQKELNPTTPEMTMGEVIKQLNEITKGEAVLVTDVGQHQMVACRYTLFNKTRSNVTSGGLGTMGFALPAAIGAKFGAPEREVVAIIGDGGFQMTLQELGTIMQKPRFCAAGCRIWYRREINFGQERPAFHFTGNDRPQRRLPAGSNGDQGEQRVSDGAAGVQCSRDQVKVITH